MIKNKKLRANNVFTGGYSALYASLRAIFSNRDGALYDSDADELRTTSIGTVLVSAVGDPVGMIQDLHLGLIPATKGAYLRVAGSHLDSPDRASNRPTGDFTLISCFAADDITPAAAQVIYIDGSVTSASTRNITLALDVDGTAALVRPTGATSRSYNSTVSLSTVVANYGKIWHKVYWQQNVAGVSQATHYYSTDGITYTQLGEVVTNANTGAGNSNTTGIHIGNNNTATATFLGKIYSTQLYDANGVLVTNFNGTDYSGSGTTVTSSTTAEVYTLQGSAYIAPDGNHALQSTAAARLTYNKRVNHLLNSNVLSAWTQVGTPTPTQNEVGIDGVANTAWTLTDNDAAANERIIRSDVSLKAGVNETYSVYVKKTIGVQTNFPALIYGNSALTHVAGVNIDTTNGAVLAWTSATGLTIVTSSAAITSHNDNFWRVSLTFLPQTTEATSYINFSPAYRNVFSANGDVIVATTGSAVIQNLQAEYGTSATRYQNIITATSFDETNFYPYVELDSVDDHTVTTTGGGGISGFFYCEAFRPLVAAGAIRTIFSDAGTNTGYKLEIDATGKLSFSVGNGVSYTTITSIGAVTPGVKTWVIAWDDGVNLNVQLDGEAVQSVARPVVSAGTTSFTLGKENGVAAKYRAGQAYSYVYWKDTGGTAAERNIAIQWARFLAGV